MLQKHVFNDQKKELVGHTFHFFIANHNDCSLYENMLEEPIIFGKPLVVSSKVTNYDDKHNPFSKIKNRMVTIYVYRRNSNDSFSPNVNLSIKEKKVSEIDKLPIAP